MVIETLKKKEKSFAICVKVFHYYIKHTLSKLFKNLSYTTLQQIMFDKLGFFSLLGLLNLLNFLV